MNKNIKHWLVILGVCILCLTGGIFNSGLGYFVGPVTKEFGFTKAAFNIYYSCLTLASIAGAPIIGKLMGKFGVRKILLIAQACIAIIFIGFSRSNSLISFYICGALMGLVFTSAMLSAVTLINAWFEKKSGMLIGIALAFTSIGGTLLGFFVPTFIAAQGWRAGYLLFSAIIAVSAAVAVLLIKNSPQSIGLQRYGHEENNVVKADPADKAELKGVPYAKALKSLPFYCVYLAIALLGINLGLMLNLPVHFTSLGFTPLQAGSLMSILMFTSMFTKMALGALNDKIGTKNNLILAYVLFFVAAILLATGRQYWIMATAMALFAVGFSLTIFPPILTSNIFGMKDYSGIFGIVVTAQTLGLTLGTPLWGLVYDITGAYTAGFYIAAVTMPIMLLLLLFALKSGKKLQASYNELKENK